MNRLIKAVIISLLIYGAALTLIYLFQDKLIFMSERLDNDFQFDFDSPSTEYFVETSDEETLNLLHFSAGHKPLGLIIYFHGNDGNLRRWGRYALDFTSLGYDVLMMDYRGYGKSTGYPTEEFLYADATLIWRWARDKFEYPKWTIYGRSLGAAVGSHLAAETNPDLLVLETPFYDINSVALTNFIPFNLKYEFPNHKHLEKVQCEKYVFHGTQDRVVPLSSAQRLAPLLTSEDHLITIPNAGHKNLRDFKKYRKKLNEILRSEIQKTH